MAVVTRERSFAFMRFASSLLLVRPRRPSPSITALKCVNYNNNLSAPSLRCTLTPLSSVSVLSSYSHINILLYLNVYFKGYFASQSSGPGPNADLFPKKNPPPTTSYPSRPSPSSPSTYSSNYNKPKTFAKPSSNTNDHGTSPSASL